jgi:hypothetical protein
VSRLDWGLFFIGQSLTLWFAATLNIQVFFATFFLLAVFAARVWAGTRKQNRSKLD